MRDRNTPRAKLGDEPAFMLGNPHVCDWGFLTTNQNRLRASRDVCGLVPVHVKIGG